MKTATHLRIRQIIAFFCIAAGAFPVLISLGVVQLADSKLEVPFWVLGLAGVVLVIAGCMMLVGEKSRANDFLAAILLSLFGVIAVWVSVFSTGEGFSGGLPFVARETNIAIARWVFGGSALVCFSLAAYALKRSFRPAGVD